VPPTQAASVNKRLVRTRPERGLRPRSIGRAAQPPNVGLPVQSDLGCTRRSAPCSPARPFSPPFGRDRTSSLTWLLTCPYTLTRQRELKQLPLQVPR